MIDFTKYPRTKEVTYTIIERQNAGELQRALWLANEKDWKIRSCKVRDKSLIDDIKEHLPNWFDARYSVLISHFEPTYLQKHIREICEDKDVKALLEQEDKIIEQEYLENYAHLENP